MSIISVCIKDFTILNKSFIEYILASIIFGLALVFSIK